MPWPKSVHGPGKGAGWGGPAKGASTSRIRKGDPEGIQRMSNDPDVKAAAEARISELKEHLYGLAKTADRQETQLAATVAYLNRELGAPKAPLEHSGPDGGAIHVRVTIDDAGAEHPGEAAA